MASIEKLVKSLEALKVLQASIDKPEEPLISTKFIKKEASISKKEKIAHCINIADIICCSQLRTMEDFQKFLGIAIETMLACCDDSDADVRSNAAECLNRTIKSNLDCHLNRIHVELYKELKKNGSSRSIRAALTRFAELAYLLRPAKCRPYLVQLIPVLEKISSRTGEESVQESIALAMKKLMPVLGRYATENEILRLLNCFLPNLSFSLVSVRRTAAISLTSICQHSKKPSYFYSWLISNLLKLFHSNQNKLNLSHSQLQETNNNLLSGIFQCLKNLFPLLSNIPEDEENQSLVIDPKQKEVFEKQMSNMKDNLLQMYELILHSLRYSSDNGVIVSGLEALLQLLRAPPKLILKNLLSIKGVGQSRLNDSSIAASIPSSPSMSVRRLKEGSSISGSTDNVASLEEDEDILIGSFSQDSRLTGDNRNTLNLNIRTSSGDIFRPESSLSEPSEAEESVFDETNVSSADNSITGVRDFQPGEKSPLYYPARILPMMLDQQQSKEEDISQSIEVPLSPAPSLPSCWESDMLLQIENIGDFTSEDTIPLEYCTRLICAKFLLSSTKNGLIPDKSIRISVKSLALSCLAPIVQLYPKAFLLDLQLYRHPPVSPQKIWDITLYSSHPDPHLRSQISLVIATYIKNVLELPLSYDEFVSVNCAPSDINDVPSLETLIMKHIYPILCESGNTSSSIRNALQSFQICLPILIKSKENIDNILAKILNRLILLKDHNYWLVKAGLLELLSNLPYTEIFYLEKRLSLAMNFNSLTKFQDIVIDEVFLPLLSDEDYRIRSSASSYLVGLVKNMFTCSNQNNGDPVIGATQNLAESYMSFFSSSSMSILPTREPFPSKLLPDEFDFIVPFVDKKGSCVYNISIESNLKYIVDKLITNLNNNSSSKAALFGCFQSLCELSEEYLVTKFPKAWGCNPEDNCRTISLLKYLSYLLSSYPPLVNDLIAHQCLLTLTGNLISGLSYQLISQSEPGGGGGGVGVGEENVNSEIGSDWGLIGKQSPLLEPILSSITQHAIKLLAIYGCVYDEVNNPFNAPTINSVVSKPQMISTLSSATLSPLRKKTAKPDSEKSEARKSGAEKERNKMLQRQLSITADPLTWRLYEIMKSTYQSSKITLDMSESKLGPLLESILTLLSQLLEVASFRYFVRFSEDILDHFKIVITHEPQAAVKCVHQLLKCLFGLNLVSLLSSDREGSTDKSEPLLKVTLTCASHQPMDYSSCSLPLTSTCSGLYQVVIARPYSNFSDYTTSRAPSLNSFTSSPGSVPSVSATSTCSTDDFDLWHCYFRKATEKQVSNVLDKNSALSSSSTQSTGGTNRIILTSHLRLFEPIVVKALRLYTMTSNINLQQEVLSFICQLIKLRVDYNLLDSDSIFLGFVRKQFEFIENGLLGPCDRLISVIFNFLILLSYPKEHSSPQNKSNIITAPKIIQMCIDLMASDQPPAAYALPALRPIVEDLMLYRLPTKVEPAKELNAQREVAIEVVLKLAHHRQSLYLLNLIVHQSRKEGEEKWKKISRLIIGAILPLLVRQSLYIESYSDLEVVHHLFESVSPAVYLIDYLAEALFTPPDPKFLQDHQIFQRWISSVLVILRVLIIHVKEEIVLACLDHYLPSSTFFDLKWIRDDSLMSDEAFEASSPDNASVTLIAEFMFNVVRVCAETLIHYLESTSPLLRNRSTFLVQQISCLLLYMTHMFQSGSYRRVAKRSSELLKEMISRNSILGSINAAFGKIESHYPTIMFQWCNILMLLGFDDHGTHRFWYKLIKGFEPKKHDHSATMKAESDSLEGSCKDTSSSCNEESNGTNGEQIASQNCHHPSLNIEMIRRSALILMCDFVCENMNDVEQLTWLIINNITEIIRWSYEPPIADFIHAVHRNQASSGLFLQAVGARCDNFCDSVFLKRLLLCIELSHETQSGSLVSLIAEKILTNPQTEAYLSIKMTAQEIAMKKVKFLSKIDSPEDAILQLSLDDTDKIIHSLETRKHRELMDLLKDYRKFISPTSESDHPLNEKDTNSLTFTELNRSKDWFLQFFPNFYESHTIDWMEVAILLNKCSPEELYSIFGHKVYGLTILSKCLTTATKLTLFNEEPNSEPQPLKGNILLKACMASSQQHLLKIQSYLPSVHSPFSSSGEMFTARDMKHRDSLVELFSQKFIKDYIVSLVPVYNAFACYADESRCFENKLEARELILRIAVLYAELLHFDLESKDYNNIESYISLLYDLTKRSSLMLLLCETKNVSLLCSVISSVHLTVRLSFGDLHEISLRKSFQEKENLTKQERSDYRHLIRACDRIVELMMFLKLSESNTSSSSTSTFTSKLPLSLLKKIKRIIISLARIPFINSVALIPPSIWQQDLWSPEFTGYFGTVCSTVPSDYLRDKDILKQLIDRIGSLGWINRIQFEELWMSLLGVISPIQEADETFEDAQDKLLIATIGIDGITTLLIQSLRYPVAGNPLKPLYSFNHSRTAAFMHTKFGEKLSQLKFILSGTNGIEEIHLEGTHCITSKRLFSVDYLRKQIGIISSIDLTPPTSSGSSSESSSTVQSPTSQGAPDLYTPRTPENVPPKENIEIDLSSCIHFLFELYGQLITSHISRSPLIIELCRSIASLMDLFFEKSQYEWVLSIFLDLFRLSSTNEDEMVTQYLAFGVSKSAAVLAIDNDQLIEKCKKCVESSLKSSLLPTRIHTLYGVWYILEKKNTLPGGKEVQFLPCVSEYLVKHLGDENLPSSHNEEHVTLMWELSFHLIETFVDSFADNDFAQKIFLLSLKTISSQSHNSRIYGTVCNGLMRLLVCEIFSIKDAEAIIRISTEKLKLTKLPTNESISSLRLMVTSIYIYGLSFASEKSLAMSAPPQPQPVSPMATSTVSTSVVITSDNNEDLLFAMERVRLIFDRLKVCNKQEAQLIASIIPQILCDFLPTQEILNKIIGEFLSNQNIYPQHMATIIYKVFKILRQQSESLMIQEWVLLSLSSFTQIQPISSAIWSLSCFLASAASNVWIRSLFYCLVASNGLNENKNEEIFYLCCCNFYDELTKDQQKKAFLSVFENVAKPDTPYTKVLNNLKKS